VTYGFTSLPCGLAHVSNGSCQSASFEESVELVRYYALGDLHTIQLSIGYTAGLGWTCVQPQHRGRGSLPPQLVALQFFTESFSLRSVLSTTPFQYLSSHDVVGLWMREPPGSKPECLDLHNVALGDSQPRLSSSFKSARTYSLYAAAGSSRLLGGSDKPRQYGYDYRSCALHCLHFNDRQELQEVHKVEAGPKTWVCTRRATAV
jgi:hypothetical protein